MLVFPTPSPTLDVDDSNFHLGTFSATDIRVMFVSYVLLQVDVYPLSGVEIKYMKTEFRCI